ncbi:type II toxin-antitoxin system Phd/YefM family antitoxin [Limosilactobacillus equigenerosi]|uniref:Antitoxin n=1 Tax=Limosilactobacillus equigenerosi DSM 18793 = JCM 14505 TaxID=1423742 RepID=A0A0R1UUJ5_9LACO|nr:type II toxin-antitoxin system Phd/YefM family antitoxin [Limosilactobacillus equigenerosi]KRL95064.1 hypothetical protein FC21_GL001111 [Limosilactobacillus equigenerosi DSM 18793 = JCM 14505]
MDKLSQLKFKEGLDTYLHQVVDDKKLLEVTLSDHHASVVIMDKAEFDSWKETVYIMSNPELVAKIQRGKKQIETGQGQVHELIEIDD